MHEVIKVTEFLQKFEGELAMRVELAVANERGKWEEERKRVWQQQQQSLLATAHQEWSKAQESVLRAELERSRKEWERETENTKQVIFQRTHVHVQCLFFSCCFHLV